MRACVLAILVIIGMIFTYFIQSRSFKDQDTEWTVLSVGIPKKISPASAMANMGFYILKQTHEPILRETGLASYESRILKTWSRNESNTLFSLCPDANQSFNEATPFDHIFLEKHLEKTLVQLQRRGEVSINDECVIVKFMSPFPGFLSILSRYENAPSIPSENTTWEIGLGPFEVKGKTDDELFLKRKLPTNSGFTSIRFIDYKGSRDPRLHDRSIEDFNRVFLTDQPEWIAQEYKSFGVTILQTVNLFINIPDEQIRSLIFNCLSVSQLRKSFMHRQNEFSDINGVFPVGLAGAHQSQVKQSCNSSLISRHRRLQFINWHSGNETALSKLFLDFQKKTGIVIDIVSTSTTNFVRDVFGSRKGYDLYVVAIDAVRPELLPFIEPFVHKKKRLIDVGPILDKELNLIEDNPSSPEVTKLANEIGERVLNENIVLPLYQEIRTFYYPKRVKGIAIGRDFLEYPEVMDLGI